MIGHNHSHDINASSLSKLLDSKSNKNAVLIRKVVITGCIVNALLMVLKLVVGYLGHSDALVADGYHSLSDVAADLIMLMFVGISFRPADERYSYGYGKYQTFSSFLISCALLFVAFEIAHGAIESIIEYSGGVVLPQPSIWTVVVVILSMIGKEFLFRYYRRASRRTNTVALLTNAWHHRSDAMASVATLIGVSFAHFLGESWRILDPVASLLLVIFIVVPAFRMIMPAFRELMDHSLDPAIIAKAREAARSTCGVEEIAYIKGRKNGHYMILNIGICVNPVITVEQGYVIASRVEEQERETLGENLMMSVTTMPVHKANRPISEGFRR